MTTGIEYLDEVINPTAGCWPASAGCQNCYACRTAFGLANRFGLEKYQGVLRPDGSWSGEVKLFPDELKKIGKGGKGKIVGIGFMSDLFYREVPVFFIGEVLSKLSDYHKNCYLFLTKRPRIMAGIIREWEGITEADITHLWFGTSVENQVAADSRIPEMLEIPGNRWLSVEPLIGPVDLHCGFLSSLNQFGWIVAGCETGPGARPCHPDWLRSIRDQAKDSGVPFYLKAVRPKRRGDDEYDVLDGRRWKETPW